MPLVRLCRRLPDYLKLVPLVIRAAIYRSAPEIRIEAARHALYAELEALRTTLTLRNGPVFASLHNGVYPVYDVCGPVG